MACEDAVARAEAPYLDSLATVTGHGFHLGGLRLDLGAGREPGVLWFRPDGEER